MTATSEQDKQKATEIVLSLTSKYSVIHASDILVAKIATALAEERERAAEIAETHSTTDCNGPDCGIVIATAIRQQPQSI